MPLAPSHPAGTPLLPANSFAGQVAVITEPGDAVGLAIAVELARGGARIVLADTDFETAEEGFDRAFAAAFEAGGEPEALGVDLTDEDAVRRAFDQIERDRGPISILVNNVRRSRGDCPVELMSAREWRDVTHEVIDRTFICCRELGLRRIADGKSAAIVNGGTPYDITGGAGSAHKTAAQAAIMNLTKSLAVEWAPYDIRVNGIAPGYVAGAEAGPVPESELAATVPAGRLCEPHEIAWLVAYMCSPFAAYLTGHTFVVDGASWERPGRSPPLFEPIRARYERAKS